ncbi:MAG: hypothetical protein WC699_16430 [Bacteroidales bacterium]|jgi:hypothetical protein
MKQSGTFLLFLFLAGLALGQDFRQYESFTTKTRWSSSTGIDSLNHSSQRDLYPFTQPIEFDRSYPFKKNWANLLYNKVFHENLVLIDKPGYLITADPLFDVGLGRETVRNTPLWLNTRGVQVYGRIELGRKVKSIKNVKKGENGKSGERDSVVGGQPVVEFYTSYYESQGRFPHYMDSVASISGGIPGQGSIYRPSGIWDHSYSTAWTRYTPNRIFSFELGTGKNFFGNGYRSMLLSDNARNYPYFRIDTRFWRIHYTNLWSEFQDVNYRMDPKSPYQKKYGAFHYLSYSITNRLELSFFEAIIWQGRDSLHTRGFEFNYLNPIIFLRPVEWTLGSPDNALLGLNLNYKILENSSIYGQLLIDEFPIAHLKARDGYWANKYGGQIGAKGFFKIREASSVKREAEDSTSLSLHASPLTPHDSPHGKKVFLQSELNFARPYTYSHWTSKQNYGHFNQPLAHPLGANFIEWVSFARLHWDRFFMEGRYSWAKFGANYDGLNYGQDIFLSYDIYVNDLGNYIGQGLSTTLTYKTITCSYLLNPASLLNIFVTLSDRHQVNKNQDMHNLWLSFGIRNSLRNFYYDY